MDASMERSYERLRGAYQFMEVTDRTLSCQQLTYASVTAPSRSAGSAMLTVGSTPQDKTSRWCLVQLCRALKLPLVNDDVPGRCQRADCRKEKLHLQLGAGGKLSKNDYVAIVAESKKQGFFRTFQSLTNNAAVDFTKALEDVAKED